MSTYNCSVDQWPAQKWGILYISYANSSPSLPWSTIRLMSFSSSWNGPEI